jgi:hypothetical protein
MGADQFSRKALCGKAFNGAKRERDEVSLPRLRCFYNKTGLTANHPVAFPVAAAAIPSVVHVTH